ncbi:hypothetical protein ACFVAM_16040 [Streptomyces californicus]|uniref:hypothetical protein n=1 Tax=Streptomyces californicus TaxID=67351 RepID=UPI0036AB9D48
MIIGGLSARLADARGRLIIELSRAVTDWGGQVPEDPGVAELVGLLGDAAANHHVTSSTRSELAGAVGHLRAADRLGGLLPAVTLWHLGQALQRAATLPGAQEPTTAPGEPAPPADLLSRQQRLQPSGPGVPERLRAGGVLKRSCGEPCPPGG